MTRFSQIFIVGVVTLLALAGCNNPQQASTPQTSPVGSITTPVNTSEPSTAQGKYTGLLSVVSNTKAAVQTGDFTKAKAEFEQFENVWKEVEDGIKAKSPKSYEAIEESMDKVMAVLKQSQPNKDQILAQLQSLENNINSLPKS